MEPKTFREQAAQGDMLLRRIDALPESAKTAAAEKGEFILAHSETGHNHVVAERPDVRYFSDPEDGFKAYLQVLNDDEIKAELARADRAFDETQVPSGDVILRHLRDYDTHQPIAISPGIYEIRRQREHTAEGFRRAAD